MADAALARTSFLGGEWSKTAQGRFDREDYRTALNVCVNGLPVEEGAWVRLPGKLFAGTVRGGGQGRVLAFDFQNGLPYTIEFSAGFLRFRLGTAYATTNDDQIVLAISTANPAVVQTNAASGWATGNRVQFANLGAATPLLQGRLFTIATVDSTHFSLTDAITGANIDGSTLGTLPATATVQRIQEVASPYSGVLWQPVRIVQAELQAVLLHPTIAPQVLTAKPPGVGGTWYQFTLVAWTPLDGPYLDPFTNGLTITPSATTGIVTLTLECQAYSSTAAYQIGDLVNSSSVNYQSLVNQNVGNTPASSPTKWTPVSAGIGMPGGVGFQGSDIGRLIRIRRDSDGFWAWGFITAINNQISQTLSGAVHIGNMTGNGGLAAAFDSIVQQPSTACAAITIVNADPARAYVGQNYSGASAQTIGSATLWPSSDLSFWLAQKTYVTATQAYLGFNPVGGVVAQQFTVQAGVTSVTVNLRAKQTPPASPSDGTLLGSASGISGFPVNITSSDQATAWNYVWFEVVVAGIDLSVPPPVDTRAAGQTGYTQSSVLTGYDANIYVSEAQFFSPAGTGTGTAVTFQIRGQYGLDGTSAHATWRLGAYTNLAQPTCGTYHEGRLWLGGAVDNRLDGSVSNQIFNFAPTDPVATPGGTVLDSSAIAAVLDGPGVNAINWLAADQQGIIVGSQAGDWLVQATSNNDVLTPTSIQAHRYDRLPCANIEPVRANGPLIVVPRFGRKLYEHFADVFSGKINAQNISWAFMHLTKGQIVELAFQPETTPIIWARCGDGTLIGIVYRRQSLMSSQPPNFVGAFRVALGSGRVVESICVGASPDGTTTALTMVTNDPTTGIRHVEVLNPILLEGSPMTAARYLDDAVIPSSYVVGATGVTFNGLWSLNARTVTVFAGGLDCGDFQIANGSVTVPFGDGLSQGAGGGLFTATFVSTFGGAMPALVGFTFISAGQLTRPLSPAESGSRTGPSLGMRRRAVRFGALLDNTVGGAQPEAPAISSGIQFGTSFAPSRLKPALFKQPNGVPYAPGQPWSGVYWDTMTDPDGYDGMLCWRINRPYPANVMAVETFLRTEEAK